MTTIAEAEDFTQAIASDTPTGREAFLAERLTGIGGSDAAAIVGANPYKTPYQLWLEKRGEVEPEDLSENAAVLWGTKLEDVVADHYAETKGVTVHRVRRTLRHPEHLFMMAHLDRRIVGVRAGLECKTAGEWAARSDDWGPDGSDQVPMQYILQVQHYLAVTSYERFDLAVLIGGRDFRTYTIPRNEELIELLIQSETAFWNNLQNGVEPEIRTIEDARRKYPTSLAREIEASAEIAALDSKLRVLEAEQKDLERKADDLRASIMAYMGESDTLVRRGEKLRTWKTQEAERIDVKALRDEQPAVASLFTMKTESRVFRACKLKGAA